MLELTCQFYVIRSRSKFKLLVLRFLVDVYDLYALYKQAYNDFQDILVRIIGKFKHNKIITSPLYL
jgi:hypothetical protein